MIDLTGKRAIVSGAASGIGRAAAIRLAECGADVAGIDVDTEGLGDLQADLEGHPGRVHVASVDVADESQVSGVVAALSSQWGGLDIAVINAAVFLNGEDAPAHLLDAAVWNRTIAVNLTGAFLLAKHALAPMVAQGAGSVILIGSPTGMLGVSPTFDAYSASKGGVHGLMRVLAADYAPLGVRVNCVVPGFTDTASTAFIMENDDDREALVATIPLRRPGTPREVSAAIAFLACDEASYVTGSFYHVDGGITAI